MGSGQKLHLVLDEVVARAGSNGTSTAQVNQVTWVSVAQMVNLSAWSAFLGVRRSAERTR
jgi:hypothetical protein